MTGLPRLQPAALTPVLPGALLSAVGRTLGGRTPGFAEVLGGAFRKREVRCYRSLMRANFACFRALGAATPGARSVVLPRYACPSFLHGILAAGLEPRYCDVDPDTLSIDLRGLAGVLDGSVAAVLLPNLFGLASPVEAVLRTVGAVPVVEGVDYGIGTRVDDRPLGTFTDHAILNFQEGKLLPVGGGAFLTNGDPGPPEPERARDDPVQMARMAAFSLFTVPTAYWLLRRALSVGRIDTRRLSMEDTIRRTRRESDFEFDPQAPLRGLSRFQEHLAVLLWQRVEADMAVRHRNAMAFEAGLRGLPGLSLVERGPHLTAVHYVRYPVLVHGPLRDPLIRALGAAGFEASSMYVEHGMDVDGSAFPGARRVQDELVTLPVHPRMAVTDVERACEVVSRTLRRN